MDRKAKNTSSSILRPEAAFKLVGFSQFNKVSEQNYQNPTVRVAPLFDLSKKFSSKNIIILRKICRSKLLKFSINVNAKHG